MVSAEDSDDTLAELKRLLLSAETEQLARLSRRLDDLGVRAEEIADVLPRAVRLHHANPSDLVEALEAPVTECVQRSVSRDPSTFANALFPVIGPAIRRSISEALKGLVQSLNQAMEHSLSSKGIAWRIEAARTGAPFAEVVLRHTLAYRVEQAFLIQPDSGLLIENVVDQAAIAQDPDAVSGMLTAIESFVKDAFSSGDDEGLDTVDVGDHKVWLIRGPYALLACVVRGMPPVALREQLLQISEDIHQKYGQELRTFDGNPEPLASVETDLQRCLVSEQKPAEEKKKGMSLPVLAILIALVLGLLWWGYSSWQTYQAKQQRDAAVQTLTEQLSQSPGIVLTDYQWREGVLRVQGLRDPASVDPQQFIAKAGLNPAEVQYTWRAYHDLAPEFALQRAQHAFRPSSAVTLTVSAAGVLQVAGVADPDWLARVQRDAGFVAGIRGVDISGVTDLDTALLQAVRAKVDVPDTVVLSVQQQTLQVTGTAPKAWIDQLIPAVGKVRGLQDVQLSQVRSAEVVAAEALVKQLNQTQFHFVEAATFDVAEEPVLSATADALAQLTTLADTLGSQVKVRVVGRTDGTGSRQFNTRLAGKRAQVFIGAMLARGLPGHLFEVDISLPNQASSRENPKLRRVELRVSLVPVGTKAHR